MGGWRSELAVPGSNPRMIEKVAGSGADVAFLDLEDAVALDQKVAARAIVAEGLIRSREHRPRLAFRVNALDTPYFYRDLIEVVERAGAAVSLVVVPKVNRPEDVYLVATLLTQLETAMGIPTRIGLEVQIETAEGLVNCEKIALASDRIEAMTFGPGDFAASAGMPATRIGVPDEWDARYSGHRGHYAMSRIVVAARSAGVRAIDGPYADFRDEAGLHRSCETARALGFDGKWCIHPAQIAVVNKVFRPTEDEVAWARRVVAAYETAQAEGLGAVAIDGKMIDGASIRMAERTLSSVI
ncbi:MAG: CoA ester lyase [Thermomicrobiales bacterium]|nr:CoA ester lyase [Thermomicrobiales bacterium]